ncbi:nucleotidyl transferase AbiEii/AbiGii toxin family protein, partial [Candidatus Dependentiae bacterium]|nr:nucleotidyl transferase AbiEii/AbiGii toxin family protein [Candidatus Dependentiae bacterium]
IYTDKLVAFAFRPNRIKYRDVWDIMWLHNQGVNPKLELIPHKLKDRGYSLDYFLNLFDERLLLIKEHPDCVVEFKQEMIRFLSAEHISRIVEQEQLWSFITYLLEDLGNRIKNKLS